MEKFIEDITSPEFISLALLTLWTLPWKGYALWNAVKLGHKKWFITLLILQTGALLEIIYIFFVLRQRKKRIVVDKMNNTLPPQQEPITLTPPSTVAPVKPKEKALDLDARTTN